MSGHRHTAPGQHEHDFEAARGLPEPLPAGERLLWQGAPDWRRLARRAFHARKLALYFGALIALRAATLLADGRGAADVLLASLWLGLLFGTGLALVLALAWLSARSTVYTLTDRRVVLRIGIVLTLTFNLPLARIAAAGLHLERDGHGDLPLALAGTDRIAWLHLWPHARPWRIARPEPMLRAVPDAERVARLLAGAWSQATGLAAAGAGPASESSAGPAPAHAVAPLVPAH